MTSGWESSAYSSGLLEGYEAFSDLGLWKSATRMVADVDKAVIQLLRRRGTLLEHSVQEPEDAVADHPFAAGKLPESGIAGKQGAAGLVREGQCEGVGQRESRDSLAILCRLADSRAVEVEDLEAHGSQVIAAVRLQLEPVKEIGNAELEAQGEGCGVERATFEVDKHG